MKKMFGKLFVGLGVTLGIGGVALANAVQADASMLYRAYNPNTGEHLYTQNANEIPSVVRAGWRNEGTAWEAPDSGANVYRMFNPNNGGDHHYTLSQAEVNMLKNAGWRYEGISWKSGGSTPVYRLYNPNAKSGTHHFTVLASERDHLKKAGWRYEGVAFYSGKATSNPTPTNPDDKFLPSNPKTKRPTFIADLYKYENGKNKLVTSKGNFVTTVDAMNWAKSQDIKTYSRYFVRTDPQWFAEEWRPWVENQLSKVK